MERQHTGIQIIGVEQICRRFAYKVKKVKKIAQNDTWVPSHIVNEYTDSCISVFEGHPSITCDKSGSESVTNDPFEFQCTGRLFSKL